MIEKFASFSHQEETAKIKGDPEAFWREKIKSGGDATINTHCQEKSVLLLPVSVWAHWGFYEPFLNADQIDYAKKMYPKFNPNYKQ